MEPRSMKHNMKRKKRSTKIALLAGAVLIYMIVFIYLKSLPVSYAWMTASTSANGQIINSTATDLIKIKSNEVVYSKNGKADTSLSIENISGIEIPIKVELIVNKQPLDTASVSLEPTDSFTVNWSEITGIPMDAESMEIKVIGFNKYIDERIIVPIEHVNP
ncbi:hypothetical protein [Neobacillus drentensis]|jgi:hypothetical protein|uniref:hypothetical protein n=1 Tax=Neobacillus drentensis TaxID=220684 RepID=UPI002FFE00D1